jgi:OOP family OmpA-OmpF porin
MMKSILALVVLAAVSVPAMAEDAGNRYFGAAAGTAIFSNTSPSTNTNVFSIISGYHFNPLLAVEIDLSVFGNFTVGNGVSSSTVTGNSLQIPLVGYLPVSQDFDLIGKIGLAMNNSTSSTTLPGQADPNLTQYDVFVGLGAQYNINPEFSLLALYDNYGRFENTASPINASSFTLGLVYHH